MSRAAEFFGSRRAPPVTALALIAFGVAGCSGDMSTRFSQSSFSNPFGYQGEATGSVPAQPAQPVERRELPQYARPQSTYQSSALPPAVSAPQSYPAGVSGGGRGLASYSPTSAQPPRLETTGSVPPRSIAATRPKGTTISVGSSDTLEVLAYPYHMTPAAILSDYGYKGPRVLPP